MNRPLLPLCLLAASLAAAQSTATVSGTIRHQGKPVAGLRIQVISQGSSLFANTSSDGVYRVNGVPAGGGWLQILVHPPVDLRLAFRSWQVNGISGDLVKDFDLNSGYLLSGELRRPDGQLLANSSSLMASPFDRAIPAGEWIFGVVNQGRFELVMLPGSYALETQAPPYFSPPVVVDLRNGDVTGLFIEMLAQRGRPYPTLPPRAEFITVDPPDVDGYATVAAAPGAVLGGAEVAVINLNSHTMALASADAGGSFSARLYAPPGSAVMVKADPFVKNAANVWRDAQTGPSLPPDLNPLPGTIVHAGGAPGLQGAAQRFDSVGAFLSPPERGWAGWWLSGTTELLPAGAGVGRRLRAAGRLRVTSPAMKCAAPSASMLRMNIVHCTPCSRPECPRALKRRTRLWAAVTMVCVKASRGTRLCPVVKRWVP
ncbi:MAG: carboxypeptidase-like regulatory domain-containing protein [Bryobacterales bacterium]|nr:carboxypeptidase-like regulatory domain-containing protein [Bryobacterales bacterium]